MILSLKNIYLRLDKNATDLSEDIIQWISNIIKTQNKRVTIVICGDEPTNHWDLVVNIINMYHNYANFGIITDGRLLTSEKIDYLNTYKVSITIKYYGLNQKDIIGYDVFDENPFILDIDNLTINGILNHMSYPNDFVQGIFPIIKDYSNRHGYNLNYNYAPSICNLDKDINTDTIYNQMINISHRDTEANDLFCKNFYKIDNLISTSSRQFCFCASSIISWCVDLHGNIYFCYLSDKIVGNIFSNPIEVLINAIDFDTTKDNYICCGQCYIESMCKGGCPLIDETNKELYCDVCKAFYKPTIDMINK